MVITPLSTTRHRALSRWLLTTMLIVSMTGAALLSISSAHAADCGGVQTSIITGDICQGADIKSNDSADNPIISVLIFVMQLMTGAVGIAAIGALIYAGILYSAAGGEAGQVQKAKTIIKDTVIGVVVYGFMIIILNFVIPGGVFGQNSTVGSGTTGGSSSSGGSGAEENAQQLTLATWNVLKYDNTKAKMYAGIKEIFSHNVAVIGLQEVDSPSFNTNSLDSLASSTIGVYSKKGGNPIVWDKSRYSLVSSNYLRPVSDGEVYFPYIRLKDTSQNKEFYVMNVHMRSGASDQPQACTSTPCDTYKKQMSSVVSTLKDLQSARIPVFIIGDFNMNYRNDYLCKVTWHPCYALKKIAMVSSYDSLGLKGIASDASTVGTGKTIIDYVYYWSKSPVNTTPTSETILGPNASCSYTGATDKTGDKVYHCWNASDHKPLLVTFDMAT